MSTFLFFAEWAFRAQALIVLAFGVAMFVLLVLAGVVEAVQRFKARKGEGS
ncbi:hypothetical protein [Comamonas thiooxydans]|uniref:Uncharacterized protein n=1 Tax=Comamonas thiooxydans TaxID=363952 RepID=A0A0E3CBK7_9BURK|nr:hypothetical protein [Comamonas thiooxydans]KGH04699.1 hypothetical protein P608_24075 [Comamonas thiooxydans]KGH18741.1 hypothetical protein P607_13370 [Comamonas thiooxydans]KGH19702.1 hypothetical protein P606_22825 [Comamonas thiooxydans]